MSIVKIIFENNDFVVCDKPAMTLSTPDRFQTDRPCLGLALQDQLGMQIFPVHRLDFEVSGLIIYAKNAQAHKASQNWFAHKKIKKTYEALTMTQNFDHWPQNLPTVRDQINFQALKTFEWQMRIKRGKKRSFESPHGDLSITQAQMLESIEVVTLNKTQQNILRWRLNPITGRSHQLRLELSRHGFPIIQDTLYGGRSQLFFDFNSFWPYNGIALRATEIELDNQQADHFKLPTVIKTDATRQF